MRIAPFSELTTRERERFFQAVSAGGLPPAFASAAEMEPYLLGPAFEAGSTYLTLWDGETLAGAIGVVVREVAVKGEVFLTLLYVLAAETEAVLGRLLRAAYAVVGATPEVVVKIGVGAKQSHLHEPLERAGCRMAYRVLNMVRPVDGALPAASAAVGFEPLSAANAADYLIVHNAAFLHSPNGSQMTPAQVDALRLEVRCPDFVQVGYAGSEPAALFEVDVRGETGQIHTVGVAPGFQGRGLGRAAVARAMETLAEAGARTAQLQVVDANLPAVALYERCGFVVDHVVSNWYYGPGPGTITS